MTPTAFLSFSGCSAASAAAESQTDVSESGLEEAV